MHLPCASNEKYSAVFLSFAEKSYFPLSLSAKMLSERARGPVSYPSFSPRHRDGRTGRSYNGEGGEGEREFELAGRIEGEGGIILGLLCFRSRPVWRRTPGSERASKWPDSSLSNTRSGVVSSYFFGKLGKISSSYVGLAPFSWYRTSEDAPLSMFASRIRRFLPSSELNTNDRIRLRRGVIEATRPRFCRGRGGCPLFRLSSFDVLGGSWRSVARQPRSRSISILQIYSMILDSTLLLLFVEGMGNRRCMQPLAGP